MKSAFQILQIVGASVGIVIGAIMFLVLFFRGMAWMDGWIKTRSATDLRRRTGAPGIKNGKKQDGLIGRKVARERVIGKRLKSNSGQASNGLARNFLSDRSTQTVSSNTKRHTVNRDRPFQRKSTAVSTRKSDAKKTIVERLASIHLLSGEVLVQVKFLLKERIERLRDKICFYSLGTILVEDETGRLVVVREQNIKMIVWTAEQTIPSLPNVVKNQLTQNN